MQPVADEVDEEERVEVPALLLVAGEEIADDSELKIDVTAVEEDATEEDRMILLLDKELDPADVGRIDEINASVELEMTLECIDVLIGKLDAAVLDTTTLDDAVFDTGELDIRTLLVVARPVVSPWVVVGFD